MASQKRSALGNNPLNQGIFTKTVEPEETINSAVSTEPQVTAPPNNQQTEKKESRKKNQDSRLLKNDQTEKVNLRLSIEINDWLDRLLKEGRRKHGRKIPKEAWVQAALELFRSMPINWEQIDSEETLRSTLANLESKINDINK